MKRAIFLIACWLAAGGPSWAQAGRIYTKPGVADSSHHGEDAMYTGSLSGQVQVPVTHAIAVERDLTRVYRADIQGQSFTFPHLPTGKYDLVFVTPEGAIFEGLSLGENLATDSLGTIEERIRAADGFFDQYRIHRIGLNGETALVFVERYRADNILKGSGEALGKMVRRLEVIELLKAADDWQMLRSRHLYREAEPKGTFLRSTYLPALGNIRVVNAGKELGLLKFAP